MPQLTYPLDCGIAVAGMLADGDLGVEITSKVCSEVVPHGRAVVLDADGRVSLPKTAGSIPANGVGSLVGFAVFVGARENLASGNRPYQVGEVLAILRKGRIWVEANGTLPTENAAFVIQNASNDTLTNVQHRGKISTSIAANSTVGSEATAFTKGVVRGATAAAGSQPQLARIDVNLP